MLTDVRWVSRLKEAFRLWPRRTLFVKVVWQKTILLQTIRGLMDQQFTEIIHRGQQMEAWLTCSSTIRAKKYE